MRVVVLWVMLLCVMLVRCQEDAYALGEPLQMECIDPIDDHWTAGPRCGDSKLEIKYGVDGMNHCMIPLLNEETYRAIGDVVSLRKTWNCRVRMSPKSEIWVPFNIPLWGLVETTHIHVDNHMNMIFHGFRGKIIGVAAYPLKDQFEFGAIGSTLHLHGSTKWFKKGSFAGFSHSLAEADNPLPAIISISFLCSSITLMVSVMAMIGVYDCYLKPNLLKKLKKLKTA